MKFFDIYNFSKLKIFLTLKKYCLFEYLAKVSDTLTDLDFLEPLLMPEADENGNNVWPSQKLINERYSEMNPWDKEWYDLDKGPMRYRIG